MNNGETSSLMLMFLVPDHLFVRSTVLHRRGAGLVLLSATGGEGRGQLCAVLSSWFSVVSGSKNINTDRGCGRAMDQHNALVPWQQSRPRCHYGPRVANRPSISVCSSLLLSLEICLSPQNTDHTVSLSPLHHHIFAHLEVLGRPAFSSYLRQAPPGRHVGLVLPLHPYGTGQT